MRGSDDKCTNQERAVSTVALKLDRLLAETMKPGFFGRVSIECVIQDGVLKSAVPQQSENLKFN